MQRVHELPAGRKNLKVALWWPEKQSDAHDDIDLEVFDGVGVSLGRSTWGGSVWEIVKKTGNLTPGTYRFRFTPYSMPRATQVVYWTGVMSYQ